MLRSRFEAVPEAFVKRLVPSNMEHKPNPTVISTLIDLVMFAQCSLAFEISVNCIRNNFFLY